MKNPLIAIILCATLAGCGGLHVSWVATASYNTQAATGAQIAHGVDAK